jgi:probable HAF family extracellular repeat protein
VAISVNNRGEIGGYARADVPNGPLHQAVIWDNGAMREIGGELGNGSSRIEGINDKGLAVGSGPNGVMTWKDGTWTALGFSGSAHDANKSGEIVGSYDSGGTGRAFLYRDGAFLDLGSLGGFLTSAEAINERGLVVGMGWRPDFFNRGFFYQDGVLRELGTFGGDRGGAFDVNNRGDIVGFAQDATGKGIAFITDTSGVLRPVANFPDSSTAWAINDHGAIVGSSDSGAFLVEDGVVTMLAALPAVQAAGWSQLFPLDINDRGWIVGWGWRRGGGFAEEAFVLKPR